MMDMSLPTQSPLWVFDEQHRTGDKVLCGVDEAGRGPLCGPVTVAAVVLPPSLALGGINDSKKLSEKKRAILFEKITQNALAFCVVHVPAETIDALNIHHATLLGMKQAVEGLSFVPDTVLVDGKFAPDIAPACECVVKGDATSAVIAAASILAKVSRDRLMAQLALEYPQYKLEQHKGYPTKLHYTLLEEHGVAPIYRKTFLTKRGLA